MIDQLRRLENLLFGPSPSHLGRPGRLLQSVLRYAYALARDLAFGDINLRAMSLVYTTLLSIVPLIAFCFSIVKGLGLHHDFEPLIFEFFRPLGDRAHEFTTSVMGFVERVKGGVLGSLGLAFLVFSVISVIQKVEDAFNHIWHVDRARSFARRFTEYLSMLLVGPVLVVGALGLVASLSTQSLVVWLASHEPFGAMFVALGRLGPLLVVTTGFTFLYSFIPNTRVRFTVALVAGLSAAAVWVAASFAFAQLVAYSSQMMAIYTGFAVVLLALMWIWLNWLILLSGALFAFYLQNPQYLRSGQREVLPTARLRERLALSVMLVVARDFEHGQRRWTVGELAELLDTPGIALGPIVDALEAAGLVETTDLETLLPGRDPGAMTLDAVLAAVRDGESGRALTLREARILPAAEAVCADVDASIRTAIGHLTVRDLVHRAPAGVGGTGDAPRPSAAPPG